MSEEMTKKERIAMQKAEKAAKKAAVERKAQTQKVLFAVILVLIVVGIIAIFKIAQPSVDEVGNVYADPTVGPAEATVVLTEYADFQCPACAGVQPVIEDILEEYEGKIKYVYNDFPLPQHQYATDAAVGGECVARQGSDAFMHYADQMFGNQDSWAAGSKADAIDAFRRYAEETGIDMTTFDTCVASNDAAEAVEEDLAEARSLSVNATPTFFVNGKRIVETPYSSKIREALDEALAEAETAAE